mgnify:CR=1 FL=1
MMHINGVTYHVNVIGNGPKIVVFLHGFTGRGENWESIIPFINNKELFTFVLPDILGHGFSDKPKDVNRYSIENTVDDLHEMIKSFTEEKVYLIGYSMGGRVALSFANNYPQRLQGVLLESASPGLRTEEERQLRQQADENLAKKIETDGITCFIDFWTNIPLFESQKSLSEDKQQKVLQQRLQNNVTGLANSLRGIGTGSQPSYWKDLQSLSIPITLLAGEYDSKFVEIAKKMASLLPLSNFIEINKAGHAIHVEQSEKFGKIVSEFLLEQQKEE